MTPIFHGTKKSQVHLDDINGYASYLDSIEDGTRVAVTVEILVGLRTLDQNAYYWKIVVRILGGHLGYEDEEMHELYKTHANFGESTADLLKDQFSDFIERCIRWAAIEHGVIIPPANKVKA